jgi:hypothetical protein
MKTKLVTAALSACMLLRAMASVWACVRSSTSLEDVILTPMLTILDMQRALLNPLRYVRQDTHSGARLPGRALPDFNQIGGG